MDEVGLVPADSFEDLVRAGSAPCTAEPSG